MSSTSTMPDGLGRLSRCGIAALSIVIALTSGGCMTMQMIREATPDPKLELIRVGASRTNVEGELGKPVRTQHNVATYEFHMSSISGGMAAGFLPFALLLDMSGMGLITGDNVGRINRLNTRQMNIVYGPNGKVIALSHGDSEERFREWMGGRDQFRQVEKLALAANGGYAPAQFTQAVRYRYGLWNTEIDPVKAYVWARLAEFGGHRGARVALVDWAKAMSVGQVAEGERRFRLWEPESVPESTPGTQMP